MEVNSGRLPRNDCLRSNQLVSTFKKNNLIDLRPSLPELSSSQRLPPFDLTMSETAVGEQVQLNDAQDPPPSSNAEPPSKMSFLSLPPEIRIMIYEYAYSGTTILLTCKQDGKSIWATPTSNLVAIAPFHDLGRSTSDLGQSLCPSQMRVSINTPGLLTTRRVVYRESIELMSPLTEVHVDQHTVERVCANRYMPATWMRRVRHLGVSAYLEDFELQELRDWYPELRVLEIHDFELQSAVATLRSEILGLSDHEILVLFFERDIDGWLEVYRSMGGPLSVDRSVILGYLAGIELRISRLVWCDFAGSNVGIVSLRVLGAY